MLNYTDMDAWCLVLYF